MEPWLLPEVVTWLESVLTPQSIVLETGAGASTVWLAQRVGILISYESELSWANKVRADIELRRFTNVDFRFEPSYPTVGLKYIPQGQIDLALIDGRGRVRSIQDAWPAVRSGGWLVLDDSSRDRYESAVCTLDEAAPAKAIFQGEDSNKQQWQTTAWRKR